MLKSKSTFDVRKALAFRSAGVRCGLTPARQTWQRPARHIRSSASRETLARYQMKPDILQGRHKIDRDKLLLQPDSNIPSTRCLQYYNRASSHHLIDIQRLTCRFYRQLDAVSHRDDRFVLPLSDIFRLA